MKTIHILKSILFCCFLTPLLSTPATAQKKIRIISYNILEGMKLDTTKGKQEFVKWVKSYNPDILALQEVNKFTQTTLEEMAAKYGHPYAVLLKEQGFPVAVTSKFPITDVRKVLENMHHGFIVCKINGLNVIVLHFSPHKYLKRREEAETIVRTIAAEPDHNKWIVMGDFNSLSPLDKANYADGKLIERMQAAAKKYSFHHNLIDGQYLDFEVQQKILESGLLDAAKLKSTGDEQKSTRIDYIYVSEDLMPTVTRAEFLRDDFTKKYSDHVPVIMEFKYKK